MATTSNLVRPHGGGDLKPLMPTGDALAQARAHAEGLRKLPITSREAGDLIMMGIGGFTPLTGFMGKADWQGVVDSMAMANGLFWPIPITLSADEAIEPGTELALFDAERDAIIATITVSESYQIDKAHECREVFKTTDEAHPGVKMVMAQKAWNIAGDVVVLTAGEFPDEYPDLFKTPAQTRADFEAAGWKTIAAFQTRNPMHRSHEYLCKVAIETLDGVLVHSLLGKLKPGDIPADVRTKAIRTLVDRYFVPNTVMQAGYPLDMRYAGPREALLHALFRQNYGCSHLIVGRDHAGVGDYYGAFDAHDIFDQIPEDALETQPLKMDWTFWSHRVGGMASMRTCPGSAEDRVLISGSKLRKMLSEGEDVPETFSRPEVLEILRAHYEGLADADRVTVELKGHSAR